VKTKHLLVLPATLLLGACASVPPPELNNAQTAYDRAAQGPAAQLAPADLHAAQEQLNAAKQKFDDSGDSQETRDLAYSAQRKAEIAEVRARTIAERQEQQTSKAQLDQFNAQQVKLTSAELAVTKQELATAQQQRAAAERRAAQAAADLARIASVKQEPRGMVITLSGSVLFATAKYDLLGQAQQKLNDVANVLSQQDPDSKIVVQGYTDSQGSESFNMELSQHRAEAVRTYLAAHGVASDRITAQGMGPANPVADNATAEGRADNRRVEIVVQPGKSAATTN
jgi:outer membrane protein OmpA-like peptidoglycan-associated protein